MAISVFDLFSVGIGPSSSHTVGPMRAARRFVVGLDENGRLADVARIQCVLHGSLGATGKGHGSDKAVILGLAGHDPETVPVDEADDIVAEVRASKRLSVLGRHDVDWTPKVDLVFRRQALGFHPNGLRFTALDADGELLDERTYYSVGGGFVVDGDDAGPATPVVLDTAPDVPFPFRTGVELLDRCADADGSIASVMLANETARRPEAEVRAGLLEIWAVMQACVDRGCRSEGMLPGPLGVKRRAPGLRRDLTANPERSLADPLAVLDWVGLYALAVNEENAAGGRIVTAPTNGAAGIVPAVLHYYHRFVKGADDAGIVDFLLTAGAIAVLYKENASISGAEVGCQGEVGVACSMAAGALCAVLGGTPAQVENAAEIGMEHHLGLTCDPVGGLVQIPCIERNAVASVQAINAARMALRGDGTHHISLDRVIRTMRETGRDMKAKYKETSRGGLAVNIIEC